MNLLIVIAFQLLASLLIVAEVLVPSLGLLSIASAGFFFYSYYLLNSTMPNYVPILVMFNLFSVPAVIIYSIRILGNSPMSLKKRLDKTPSFGKLVEVKEGEMGTASTDLRPSGKARFSAGFFDVVSEGDYIEKHTKIIVVAVKSNTIIVKAV